MESWFSLQLFARHARIVVISNLRAMSKCSYCGDSIYGCPHCRPVEPLITTHYVFDEELNDYRECSEEEYELTDEDSRMKTYR